MSQEQKIRIVGRNSSGDAEIYLKMSHATMAEMVFYGLTHDPANQELDWYLEVNQDGEWTAINWHSNEVD